jgi:periplasmic divalent cation tolerance protein
MAEQISLSDQPDAVALVLTTLPDLSSGERLVSQLLEEGLAACGNLVPGVQSLYRWEGKIAREQEVIVLLKARTDAIERLFGRVAELHPYVVPELVAFPFGGVSAAYRKWVLESTKVTA